MTLTKEFKENTSPAILGAASYQALLESLMANGRGIGKTKNVGAFLLPGIEIATLTSAGTVETTKTIDVKLGKEQAYILLDMEQYPLPEQRALVIRDMTKGWASKILHESELPALSKPGIWINKQSAVEFDYVPVDATDSTNSERKPNVEAYRLALDMTQAVNIPVQWDGGFNIAPGGTLAIRERDVADLAEALRSIKEGRATAETALFSKPGVAKFDVYGMEPGFANGPKRQYEPVTLKDTTRALTAFVSPKAKTKTL